MDPVASIEDDAGAGAASPSRSSPSSPTSAHRTPTSEPPPAPAHSSQPVDLAEEHEGKKPRACDRCRGLKVRCVMDEEDGGGGGGPCRRCAKARRRCVVSQPTRKRQRKTDTRVAELERKIDALTATLNASRAAGEEEEGGNVSPVVGERTGSETPVGGSSWTGERRGIMVDETSHLDACGIVFERAAAAALARPDTTNKRKFNDIDDGEDDDDADPSSPPRQTMGPGYRDIVTRGLVPPDQAARLFTRYTDDMCPHLPGVVFPAGTPWTRVRADRPLLFLAVMAAAAASEEAAGGGGLQRALVRELTRVLAEKIVVVGEKSMELVQALHVAVFWYWPPGHLEELKFYQMVHMAAVLAIDLGLGRSRPAGPRRGGVGGGGHYIPWSLRGGGAGGTRMTTSPDTHRRKRHRPPPDPCSVEARRTWLTCYFLATNTAMTLHRPNLVRWTAFMAESIEVLRTSPDAAPTDAYLCHLVWTHRLSEDVGVQFRLDDPAAAVDLADAGVRRALAGFGRELERYRDGVEPDMRRPTLELGFHVVSLYMHEIALRSVEPSPSSSSSTTTTTTRQTSQQPLTSAHVNALSACLVAVDGIFDTFLSLTPEAVRCLPVFNFVRVAYATVVLIKMYFAAAAPGAELGRVVDCEGEMRVAERLGGLLEKFRAAAEGGRSRPAAKFHIVIAMLRSWFQRQQARSVPVPVPPEDVVVQGGSAPGLDAAGSATTDSDTRQQPQQQQQHSSESTAPFLPTQEASGTSTSAATARTTPSTMPWYTTEPQQPFMYAAQSTSPSDNNTLSWPQPQQTPSQHHWNALGIDTSGLQGMDLGYSGAGDSAVLVSAGDDDIFHGMFASLPSGAEAAASESWYGGILDSAGMGMGGMYHF